MGLDMYLNRMPRYKDATAHDVSVVENYLDWQRAKAAGSEYAQCSFEEWCGAKDIPDEDCFKFYQQHERVTYSEYDVKKERPWYRIKEEVGYWRKANAIHKWFVENVQDGIDDCDYHREVTKEDLEELLDICHKVLCNHGLAKSLLPTESGFFFGSTQYDDWYRDDLKKTIDICNQALATTDFDKQMIYYVSSW